MKILLAAAPLLAQVAPIPPAQVPLQPSGKWTVEFAEGMCVVSRRYAAGAETVQLGLRTATSDKTATLLYVRPANGSTKTRSGKLAVSADGVSLSDAEPYDSRVARTAGVRVETAEIERTMLPALTKAKAVTLAYDKQAPVSFTLSGTDKALAVLKVCERDLMKSWGMDLAMYDRIATAAAPVGDLANAFSASNYPSEARRANLMGRAVAIITIGTDGRVGDCRIAVTSKVASLDEATCQGTRKVRYTPAKDAAGTSIASQEYFAVNWQLED